MNGRLTSFSLFSGIGGIDIAAEQCGFAPVGFVERDPFCRRILANHWPGVPIWSDVRRVVADTDGRLCDDAGTPIRAGWATADDGVFDRRLTLLTGGFPCQPHSVAGKRGASGDERDLWSECARIAGLLRPTWCVWENVPGLLSSESGRFFARVVGDMAALGYRVAWGVWGAASVGAPHRRERVFIVCHDSDRDGGRCGEQWIEEYGAVEGASRREPDGLCASRRREGADVADAECGERELDRKHQRMGRLRVMGKEGDAGRGIQNRNDRLAQPGVGRPPDGLPRWLAGRSTGPDEWAQAWSRGAWEEGIARVSVGVPERVAKLRALGNAVVPAQIQPLLAAIADYERGLRAMGER